MAGGVNSLRDFRAFGRGVRLWSARTLDPDLERRLFPVQRLLIHADLDRARLAVGRVGVQWRAALGACAGGGRHVSDDAVAGRKAAGCGPNEAFFVRCDQSTMTQQDLDEGRLVCMIGVATLQPAPSS